MSWTMMRRMILCLACAVLARAAAASPFVCVVITGFNAVDTCVRALVLDGDRGLVSGL